MKEKDRCFVGVDIGGTSIKFGTFLNEKLIKTWTIHTNADETRIVTDIVESIRTHQTKGTQIAGIGLGVPGDVTIDGLVCQAVNIGWENYPLGREIQRYLSVPISAAGDAKLAALAEHWKGAAGSFDSFVMITLGTGLGGGIMIHGRILNGVNGAAGEIGHIPINPKENRACACGKQGCLEQYASARGLVCITRDLLAESDKRSALRGKKITAKLILDAVKEKDEIAKEALKIFAEYLGRGLAAISCVVSPQAFVIGGGVSYAGEILIKAVRPVYQKAAYRSCKDVEFHLAQLGNQAGIYGAARLAMYGPEQIFI